MSASPKPRLNMLTFDYPPLDGGVSRLCSNLAVALQREGLGVEVITHRPNTGFDGPTAPSVSTLKVPSARPLREIVTLTELRARRDVPILVPTWYPEGLVATLSRARHVAVLALGAELFPPVGIFRRWWWPRLEGRVLRSASVVVAISRYTASLVQSAAKGARVEIVPLAVDESVFSPGDRRQARRRWGLSESATVLLSVSRIQRYKGHDTVLQAMATLSPSQREEVIFVVAGRGSAETELKRLASRLGVAEKVRWLGFVPDEQLPSLYHAADLFVLCTREEPAKRAVEGFGLVFLEAQACGVPTIGTECGGIPDAVENDNGGWLIPPGNPEALASLIGRLLIAPQEIRDMGARARARVLGGFTWRHFARQFLGVLERNGVLSRE